MTYCGVTVHADTKDHCKQLLTGFNSTVFNTVFNNGNLYVSERKRDEEYLLVIVTDKISEMLTVQFRGVVWKLNCAGS